MSNPSLDPRVLAEENQRLKNELGRLRHYVISQVDPDYEQILESYHFLADRTARRRWTDKIAVDIVAVLKRRLVAQAGPNGRIPRSVPCPLCGDISSARNSTGFSLPDGLLRHLRGTYGAHQCTITREAIAMARSSWEYFHGAADRAEDAALLAAR